ncbi:hypothetical protein F4821DRAFT_262725 [Hypoxylon rubiginosum]|uniref:Uncharacterized protein n=1 Tax=Hypoxylon rubiginosum TaxID=110542 RepID=A0ACC0CT44_9PEZI|nr:hypothetical protein F4821DRAFT_262725 [Hypoxylon rubiginosum]
MSLPPPRPAVSRYSTSSPAALLGAFDACIEGHKSLYNAGILHRDTSSTILMINENATNPSERAFLIDLDMATNHVCLQRYITAEGQNITLASTTKCFGQTHYKFQSGKVPLSNLTLPLGANFEFYDRASICWVKDFKEPLTFEHLCGIYIPDGLLTTILPAVQHPPPIVNGPTSYEVQANQTKYPSHMSLPLMSATIFV